MVKYAGPDQPAETAGGISSQDTLFSVLRMARLLGESRSGYYAYVKRAAATVLTPRQQRRADLAVKILDVHTESDGTYGSPRITTELRDRDETVASRSTTIVPAWTGAPAWRHTHARAAARAVRIAVNASLPVLA
jgi:hypothetical protein